MGHRLWAVGACAAVAASLLPAPRPCAAAEPVAPATLAQDPNESIYLPQGPPREEEGVNAGGVNFNLRVSYLTDYVYRGVDQSERLASLDSNGHFVPDANV